MRAALDAGTFSLLVAQGRDPISFEEAARQVHRQSQESYHAERRMVSNYVTSSSCSLTGHIDLPVMDRPRQKVV